MLDFSDPIRGGAAKPSPESKRRRQERREWAKVAKQSERHVSKQKLKQMMRGQ